MACCYANIFYLKQSWREGACFLSAAMVE
jgi:hypothetical protein